MLPSTPLPTQQYCISIWLKSKFPLLRFLQFSSDFKKKYYSAIKYEWPGASCFSSIFRTSKVLFRNFSTDVILFKEKLQKMYRTIIGITLLTGLQDFRKNLFLALIYGLFLIRLSVNANIVNMQIFH